MDDLTVLHQITAPMARELAAAAGVCVRPLMRRVLDRQTGTEERVAIACGSTREDICPSCAHKARILRMQQCAEGWHRTDEPEPPVGHGEDDNEGEPDRCGEDRADAEAEDAENSGSGRRVRSTRRRQDAPNLPRVPVEDRTIGRTFTAPDGKTYRPSMFLTVTLPSYGPVDGHGAPKRPGSYDYRRAALDALLFPRLVDRLWQNLRRCAGYRVQYFACVEPQKRAAPHLHAAIRGAVSRATLRAVVEATYHQVWWPPCDEPVYVERLPIWSGAELGYVDADTGEILPTWAEAVDALDGDPDARPVHVLRFGAQLDMQGIIAPSEQADRAVRYLTKYLAKSISGGACGDEEHPRHLAHLQRLQEEVQWLPCSERCANWLRYGVQPDQPGPGLVPGRCGSKAHDRENLGCGGRRVLVSRQWTGKRLDEHRADRAAIVRETLLSAGIVPPEIERMAAQQTMPDGSPRFEWSDIEAEPGLYVRVILQAVGERAQWRQQYEHAKRAGPVDGHSATTSAA